jgi:hypothetical protein
MRITKHISFFYLENRIQYINAIIEETNKYEIITDIYIHTNNKDLNKNSFHKYTNGNITIICHDLSGIHPFYLTWACRYLMKHQKDDYDIFMYIEDDILVPYKAVAYWLKYNKKLIEMNYNLGFVRIEVENNIEYITDLYGQQLDTLINLDNITYCVNNKNPYCAFWIYNKTEFDKFVNSKYYDINNIPNYGIREQSAIGLHGNGTIWYKNTIIPIVDNTHQYTLIDDCKIYHMPNNYVADKNTPFATIRFDKAIVNL